MQTSPQSTQPSRHLSGARIKQTLRIIGIGASAGGLEAFTQFLQAASPSSGMAYVLVQHLDPEHKSDLVELLSRATKLTVTEIEEGEKVQSNHVYVIPKNTELTISDSVLHLHPRTVSKHPNLPIDRFLTSLADDLQANSIGVILSGAASDGTLGLQAIKAAGGITYVQDDSANYTSMPESAIRAGAADFILPPAGIAKAIEAVHGQGLDQARLSKIPSGSAAGRSEFQEVLQLIEDHTGVNMSNYKNATLFRRIHRRLAVLDIQTLAGYVTYIKDNPTEASALYQDMLINVTSFFRDQPTIDFLKKHLLQKLQSKTSRNLQLRIWVAGCASGEEAYTLAIVCRELINRNRHDVTIKIFATDLNATAITQARSGVYTAGALSGISKEVRERYFNANGSNYQVKDTIRDMCIFATHNLLVDPPFLSMDIISCCNVMIYLKPTAQQKLLAGFHYALKPNGLLALGSSESIGASRPLFSLLDKHLKVYSRKSVQSPKRLYATSSIPSKNSVNPLNRMTDSRPDSSDSAPLANSVLLSQFTPSSVVVDSSMDIIQFHGSTSPYLEAAPGKASLNLFKMARPGLTLHLRKAVRHVKEKNEPYQRTIHVKLDAETKTLTLHALPLSSGDNAESSILIVFSDNTFDNSDKPTKEKKASRQTKNTNTDDENLMLQLEREIAEQRDEMRRLTEDHEIANEELQLANEEVRSSNEELQSLNEELETSSEELASTNEELVSMNQTLRASNEALSAARDYAEAIIATVREPLLVLNSDLRVMVANDSFYRVFKVSRRATEGSHIYELGSGQWMIPELQSMLEDTLSKNMQFQDYQVRFNFPGIGQRTMLLDALRIQTDSVSDQLILLAIEDITERQQTQQDLEATANRLQFLAASIPQKIYTATPDGSRDYFNPQWSEFLGVPVEQLIGWKWVQFIHPDDVDRTLALWKHSVETGEPYEHKNRYRRADGVYCWHLSRATAMRDNNGKIVMWVGSNTDIEDIMRTKQRSAKLEKTTITLTRQRDQLVALNKAKDEFISLASHQLRTPATGVKQYIGMLLQGYAGELSSSQREYLDQANESNDRQLRIIDDLLKVARVDSGNLTLDKTPTDLVLLTESILNEQSTGFATRQQDVTFEHTAISVIAPIDNRRLRMVLENLIDNASKYTSYGKRITVKLIRSDTDVQISISDEGVGIAKADLGHLFQKFSRLDNDMSVRVGGSGLGLYMAKKIVDLHGGSITVTSKKRKGSTFTVTLPTDENE